MNPRRTPLKVALVAAALALVLPLSGCVGSFIPKPTSATSTPTGEKVTAELKPFYDQTLSWKSCEGGEFQCATAKAPLDWTKPAEASIDLALIRAQAKGTKLGSLLVNPGGPGASGYDFIRDNLSYAVDAKLQSSYDIVGFDPRGVGHSSAVHCYQDPAAMDTYIYGISPNPVGSDAWIADQENANKTFGQDCLKYTGQLLGHIDTVSAARDLDMLRAALGDKKLNYLGYSYGTLLGATYADLFPKNTGRLVFDGAVDPSTSDFDVTATQAQGFESALRAYLAKCLAGSNCPFKGSVDAAMSTIGQLFTAVAAHPLESTDGRMLGSSALFTALIFPLYNEQNWPLLTEMLNDVKKGDPAFAFQLADSYNGRKADGTYSSNETEAFISINCLDYSSSSSVDAMRADAAKLAKLAPVLGPQMSYGGTACFDWPFPSDRKHVAIAADGSAPIIVVGTTNDPATPYVWAQNVAEQLKNGHLVTFHGEGHTAYNKSNSCVNDAVDDFFVSGTVPARDPEC